MYLKQSLLSYQLLLVYLLLGCGAIAGPLYARGYDGPKEVGENIAIFFGTNEAAKKEYLEAICKKESQKANKILKKVLQKDLSSEQKAAFEYLNNANNVDIIYSYVCGGADNDKKRAEILHYLQKRLKEQYKNSMFYPFEYQLAHSPLDSNANINALEVYLRELEKVMKGYRIMSHHIIDMPEDSSAVDEGTAIALEGCKEYIKLQNQIMLNRLEIDLAKWNNQLDDLKKILHSHPSMLYVSDSATYSRVYRILDRLKPTTMDMFLEEIKANLKAKEDAAPSYSPSNAFELDIEQAITKLIQAEKNNQIEDISLAYDAAIEHLIYLFTNHNFPPQEPLETYFSKIDQLLKEMTSAIKEVKKDDAQSSPLGGVPDGMLPHVELFGGVGLLPKKKSLKRPVLGQPDAPRRFSSNARLPNNFSQFHIGGLPWLNFRSHKTAMLVMGVLTTIVVGYQTCKKHLISKKRSLDIKEDENKLDEEAPKN